MNEHAAMKDQVTASLSALLGSDARAVEADLEQWLVEPGAPGPLAQAMSYCVLGGGKRIRPCLVRLCAQACGVDAGDETIRRAAVAIEMVHCYSLVHDDLPAMDDDVLRRGRPTAHVKFGQAMAILAGDALLTRAFGVLAEKPAPATGRLVAELAQAAGAAGMIAGQVADMDLCPVPPGQQGLAFIHSRKTAALFRCAARMGAIGAGADEQTLKALGEYALSLGLAFQLVDDLLDATGAAGQIGKTPGKDLKAGKRTHAAEIGLDASSVLADTLTRQAAAALAPLGPRANDLRRLAELLGTRTR